ncbi:pyruvate kinase [Candidatus Sumerlaeota bacterium]|nr:pyruvate kinase [Candidatus Sumerlaeota bacterium]
MLRHPHREAGSVRTKIVCTLGPSSSTREIISGLVKAGADVFRLNFSHGIHEEHRARIALIREVSAEIKRPLAILADLCGPKLRLGEIKGGEAKLEEGDSVTLTSEPADGTANRFNVNFAGFHEVATPGESILLDDGRLHFSVESVAGADVRCRVVNGGVLKSRKGVNLPDTKLPIPALTDKDRADLRFALENGADMIALSFVRSPDDLALAREEMKRIGRAAPLLVKIEKKEAVQCLEEIIRSADGAMVARGDLGIELWLEQVPAIQKRIIQLCNRLAKPVITATQMLESMISCPRPTRAEASDVYNAILDGTDAVMLSGETAAGQYPIDAVQVMNNIAWEAERDLKPTRDFHDFDEAGGTPNTTNSICHSAVQVAEQLRADHILVPTQTGYSAFHISRYKPSMPILACSTSEAAVRWMCLAWGVVPRLMRELSSEELALSNTDALVKEVIRVGRENAAISEGQRVVVLGGVPIGKTRHTNYLRVVEVT